MTTNRIGAAVLMVCLQATASFAQQPVAAETQAEQAPKVYTPGEVNLPSSRVYAFIGKGGLVGHEHGVMGGLQSGRLLLGAARDAGVLVFAMKSFDADSPAARRYVRLEGETADWMRSQINDHMHGESGLDVARYPTATFRIVSALPLPKRSERGLAQYELSGEFTLFGAARPLKITTELEMSNGWQHLTGSFKIKHSDFGRKPYSKAFGAIGIADEVTVWGDLWIAPPVATAGMNRAVPARR